MSDTRTAAERALETAAALRARAQARYRAAAPARASAPRSWYRVVAQAEAPVVDIFVYDIIGEDFWSDHAVTARSFVAELEALPAAVTTIRVHVNSPGGNAFDAIAIANSLKAQRASGRRVEVLIEALAASAATIITSAGDSIQIADNALMMVHNPSTYAAGEAGDMRQMAEALDAIRDAIVATYRWHSQLSADELAALMDATTWMSAEEAVANGFATEVVSGMAAAATLERASVSALVVPDRYRARVEALLTPAPPARTAAAATDILRLCRESACLDLAESLITDAVDVAGAQARIQTHTTARTAAAARASEIRALCATATFPELADGYINGQTSIADVRVHLTTLTARLASAEIDGGLMPAGRGADAPRINVRDVYAKRNQIQLVPKQE